MRDIRARFVTPLRVEQVGQDKWLLRDVFIFISAEQDKTVIVPPGFTTDFASVPRLPFVYLAMGNTAHAPSVIHDYLYSTKEVCRSEADSLFLEAMKVIGVSFAHRWAMYVAVRAAGWTRYGKD